MSISECVDYMIGYRLQEFLRSINGENLVYEMVSVVNKFLPYIISESDGRVRYSANDCYVDSELWEYVMLEDKFSKDLNRGRVWIGSKLDDSFVINGRKGVLENFRGDVQIGFFSKEECEDYYKRFDGDFKVYQMPVSVGDWFISSESINSMIVDFMIRYIDLLKKEEFQVQMIYVSWMIGVLRNMNFVLIDVYN